MFKRNKYSYEFRLQCVKAVLNGKQSIEKLAREKQFDESNLRLWIGFYEQYGASGLKPSCKQHYTAAFKLQVLETIDTKHLSLRPACVRFNIPSESAIVSWRKAYELNGQAGLIPQKKGRPPKMKPSIKLC